MSLADELWERTCAVLEEREKERKRKEEEYAFKLSCMIDDYLAAMLADFKKLSDDGKSQWETTYRTDYYNPTKEEQLKYKAYEFIAEKLRKEPYSLHAGYSRKPDPSNEKISIHGLIVSWKPVVK